MSDAVSDGFREQDCRDAITSLVDRLELLSTDPDSFAARQIECIQEGFSIGLSGKGGVCAYDVTSSDNWEWTFGFRQGEEVRKNGRILSEKDVRLLFGKYVEKIQHETRV